MSCCGKQTNKSPENFTVNPYNSGCNIKSKNVPINTITNFAHSPQMNCTQLENFDMYHTLGLGYKKNCRKPPSSMLGLPLTCNGTSESPRCNACTKNVKLNQPPYSFNSKQYTKFLHCLPANTKLAIEDPYNPMTFKLGCPYTPNCGCGSSKTGC